VTLLGQGVGLGDLQRSLPTPNMLGFCDPVRAASRPRHAAPGPGWFWARGSREGAWLVWALTRAPLPGGVWLQRRNAETALQERRNATGRRQLLCLQHQHAGEQDHGGHAHDGQAVRDGQVERRRGRAGGS